MADRERHVFIAKLAEQSEKYDGKSYIYTLKEVASCMEELFFFRRNGACNEVGSRIEKRT